MRPTPATLSRVPEVRTITDPPLWIDHVILAVGDVSAVAARLATQHGLLSYQVASPPGLAGRIVPCGSGYLHLLGMIDQAAGATHALGVAAQAAIGKGRPLLSWAVATEWVGSLVRRTGADVTFDEVSAAYGPLLQRQVVGADVALLGELPAVVCWEGAGQGRHPQRQPVGHAIDPVGITCIDLATDPVRLRSWLGPEVDNLPIRIRFGSSGLRAVTVGTASGDVVIDAAWLGSHVPSVPSVT